MALNVILITDVEFVARQGMGPIFAKKANRENLNPTNSRVAIMARKKDALIKLIRMHDIQNIFTSCNFNRK